MSPTVPRLKRRADFLKVALKGRKWAAPGLVMQALRRETAEADGRTGTTGPDIRLGFTVTKKVGNAVVRSKSQRVGYSRIHVRAPLVFYHRFKWVFDQRWYALI